VRQGIRRLLNRRGDIEIVGESDNGYDALHQVQDTKPDVLLLDLDMPGIDGVEVIRRVKQLSFPSGSSCSVVMATRTLSILYLNKE
jgi:DNA-binding NarL/FixJ family response regulator